MRGAFIGVGSEKKPVRARGRDLAEHVELDVDGEEKGTRIISGRLVNEMIPVPFSFPLHAASLKGVRNMDGRGCR
jgi:hypothetical protein